MPNCMCKNCNGKFVSRKTMHRHIKGEIDADISNSLPMDFPLDLGLYQSHWAAVKKISSQSGKTVLQKVFEIVKDFVFTDKHTKHYLEKRLEDVTEDFPDVADVFPKTFDQLQAFLKPFLCPLKTVDICPNDCVAFIKQHAGEQTCPVCGSSRYRAGGKNPKRTYSYMPLKERIQRMIQTQKISELLQRHKNRNFPEQRDLHDSPAWKVTYFGNGGEFADADVGIALTACFDGVNPKKCGPQHSMWPTLFSLDNFPQNIRKTCAGILICGIIPSNESKEPLSLEPYMEILVDELKELQLCTMRDHTGRPLKVSVKMLRYNLDYPAIGKVLHLPGSASSIRGCPFCDIVGKTCSHRTLFLGNRRFLPPTHPLRSESEHHVGGKEELNDSPQPPPRKDELHRLRLQYDRITSVRGKENFCKQNGVKGTYALEKLSYHNYQHQVGPDIMHTMKNAGKNLCRIMGGQISAATTKSVEENLRAIPYNNEFPLRKNVIQKVGENMLHLVYPQNTTALKVSFLTEPGKVYPTHAWHEYLSRNVMMFALKDIPVTPATRSVMLWLSTLNQMVNHNITEGSTKKLERDMILANCYMEKYFPLLFNIVSPHLLLHEPKQASQYGPVQSRWMFSFERMNSRITQRVTNMKEPEACAMKTFQLLDWVNDVILGERLPLTSCNRTNTSHIDMLLNVNETESTSSKSTSCKRKRRGQLNDAEVTLLETAMGKKIEDTKVMLQDFYVHHTSFGEKVRYDRKKIQEVKKSSRFVFIKDIERFGEIMSIFEHDGKIWFKISTYLHHIQDPFTMLPYAHVEGERDTLIVPVDVLGKPLIVGLFDDLVWFVSIDHDSHFSWLEEDD